MKLWAPGHNFQVTDAAHEAQPCGCGSCSQLVATVLLPMRCRACKERGAIAVCQAEFCYQQVIQSGLMHGPCAGETFMPTVDFGEPVELPTPTPEQMFEFAAENQRRRKAIADMQAEAHELYDGRPEFRSAMMPMPEQFDSYDAQRNEFIFPNGDRVAAEVVNRWVTADPSRVLPTFSFDKGPIRLAFD